MAGIGAANLGIPERSFRMTDWPTFRGGETIIGWNLPKFIDWVDQSENILACSSDIGMPILVLPPMQRTAVWRPKQVVDLWDSLMRGLPIGIFYLVERSGSAKAVSFQWPINAGRR